MTWSPTYATRATIYRCRAARGACGHAPDDRRRVGDLTKQLTIGKLADLLEIGTDYGLGKTPLARNSNSPVFRNTPSSEFHCLVTGKLVPISNKIAARGWCCDGRI